MKWYVAQGGQALGPYTSDEMKSFARDGSVTPESYVCREGLDEWITADRLNGLFDGVLTIKPVEQPQPIAIQRTTHHAAVARVQTIEKTGKGWKGLQLIAAMIAIAGVCITTGTQERELAMTGSLMLAGGLVLFLFARIGAWWNHG